MPTSVHIVDVPARTALSLLRRAPDPSSVRGLRSARVGLANPPRTRFVPNLSLKRVGLVAFWDDDDAIDAFTSSHPLGERFAGGWHARLEPVRAWGSWPGLDPGLPRTRHVDYDGPAVVLTLGRMRMSQAVRFLNTSLKAEIAVNEAPGLLWATTLARPPFVATCSIWPDADAISAYAFATPGAHAGAVAAGRAKPFHHEEAFVRFRPYEMQGSLHGKNPLGAAVVPIA